MRMFLSSGKLIQTELSSVTSIDDNCSGGFMVADLSRSICVYATEKHYKCACSKAAALAPEGRYANAIAKKNSDIPLNLC
jgi:hypothetical protein